MTAALIGALRVNLGLDSAQFQRGLKRSQSASDQFARKVKAAAAVAVTAMAAATVNLTRRGLEFVDNQAKMARSIDGTIDGLRALQLAGGDAGVNVRDVGTAMQRLGRQLGIAAAKGGAPAKALDRIGLSAQELIALDADERLAMIADRVQGLGLSAQETAGLLAELGIRNREMALLVVQGGDAIRAAREEVQQLGLSINQVDAAQVERANDAFSRISAATEAVSNRLAIAFAPALEAVSNAFVNAIKQGGILRTVINALGNSVGQMASIAGSFATFMGGKVVVALALAAKGALLAGTAFTTLRAILAKSLFAAAIIGAGLLFDWFRRLVQGAGGFGNALALLKDVAAAVWGNIAAGAKDLQAAINRVWINVQIGFMRMVQAVTTAWSNVLGFFGLEAQGAVDGVASTIDALEKKANGANLELLRSPSQGAGQYSDLELALGGLRAALNGTQDDMEETTDAAKDLDTALNDIGADQVTGGGGGGGGRAKALDDIADGLGTIEQRTDSVKTSVGGAFKSMVTGAKSFNEALGDVLGTLADMFLDSAFKGIWSAFGVDDIFSGLFAGIGSNANGTPNWPGGLTRVNERGGEIIDLPSGSRVYPHEVSKSMMEGDSGGVVELRIQAPEGMTVETVRNEARVVVRQEAPAIAVQAVGETNRKTRKFLG